MTASNGSKTFPFYRIFALPLAMSLAASSAGGAVRYVKADAAGANDGTSWTDAYRYFQDALVAAQSGDEIWVAAGEYKPDRDTAHPTGTGSRTATFQLKTGVKLYGGFAGVETSLNQRNVLTNVTTLSGDIGTPGSAADNSYRVVTASGVTATAVLDGFTISDGNNTSAEGAGLYVQTGSPTVVRCRFVSNTAAGHGGGAWVSEGSARFINCFFGGNIANYGGGLYVYGATGGTTELTNCVFIRNSGRYGAGFFCQNTTATVTNCTFWANNVTDDAGGGLYGAGATLNLYNTIVWGNTAATRGYQIGIETTTVNLTNCNVSNGRDDITIIYAPCTVNWVAGNVYTNPKFQAINGTIDDDLHLQADSPCIDAGNNAAVPLYSDLAGNTRRSDDPGTTDTGAGGAPVVDMGAYEYGSGPVPSRLYINDDAAGANTATDWASAGTSLDSALLTALASAGRVSEIWVAEGTYKPGVVDTSFRLVNGVAVYGGFAVGASSLADRDPAAHPTILSGVPGDPSDNSYHVVNAIATNGTATLDGFTITAGNANGASDADQRGAGIYVGNGQPTLNNLLIMGNTAATEAAALYFDWGRPQMSNVTIGANAVTGPRATSDAGVMTRSQTYLNGLLALTAGDAVVPSTLDVRSSWFDGPGRIDLGPFAKFYVSDSPFYDPVIVRTKIIGTGTIEIAPGQHMIVEGSACVDLRASGTGEPCVDPGGVPGGRILIDGTLLVRENSQVRNANVHVRQAQISQGSEIRYNDIFMLDAIQSGGEFFVEGNATIANNIITSIGDRYLDLDPDPAAAQHPTIDGNTIHVMIETSPALQQGTLLELRARDYECESGGANPACASGAFPAAVTGRFGGDPAQNWVLESLEIKPGAKLNLSNRAGFVFRTDTVRPETVYVKTLRLYPNAVLNTALQTLYYETLKLVLAVDAEGRPTEEVEWTVPPPFPSSFANGARIVDVPLLGFSLGIIAMNDTTTPPFNEFDIRVRKRLRDSQDVQDCQCNGMCPGNAPPKDETICREGAIVRLPDARDPNTHDGVMEIRTQAVDGEGHPIRRPAGSVAAKGSFARAGGEDIVVVFEYRFREAEAGTKLNVYLSDRPEVGEGLLKVAELSAPPADMAGGTGSNEYATFVGRFPRGGLNFTRGTYVELELVSARDGQNNPIPARIWIDNFDPQVWCERCADFHPDAGIGRLDFLTLVAELGRPLPTYDPDDPYPKWCLDLSGDGYVNGADVVAWDAARNGALNLCPAEPEVPLGGVPTKASAGGPIAAAGGGAVLQIAGKPDADSPFNDYFYTIDGDDALVSGPSVPRCLPGLSCDRGGGRIVRDGGGRVYHVHGAHGLIRQDGAGGTPIVVPQAGLAYRQTNRTVSVGWMTGGTGVPLADAAFDPNDATPAYVYVVPVVVAVPADGSVPAHTYRAAAKLHLMGNGSYTVETLFGLDPLQDPHTCVNVRATGDGSVQPLCDLQGLQEIEVDGQGNVFVSSARQSNLNDWILVYNESTGSESQGYEIRREWLNELFAGKAIPVPRCPTALRVSGSSDRLYVASSSNAGNGLDSYVYRFTIERSGASVGGLLFDGVVRVQHAAPGMCAEPGTCLGLTSGITAIEEDPRDGVVYVVGYSAPTFSEADVLGVNTPVFTTPTLARVGPSVAWSSVPASVGSVAGEAIAAGGLAFPVSAVYVGPTSPATDLDGDGDVDLADFGLFQGCFNGPNRPYAGPACGRMDFDGDGDVDLADFGTFQGCFNGPNRPPACE